MMINYPQRNRGPYYEQKNSISIYDLKQTTKSFHFELSNYMCIL
jgi:hypothetical protein